MTDGIFGFAAYMAILGLLIVALYRGYKSGFLTLLEFSALLAALLVYQFQNLTVFDTIPASLAFYSFMGLCGFVWDAAANENNNQGANLRRPVNFGTGLPLAAGGVCLVIMVYAIYATNIVPMEIAKAVNYGYAYAGVDINTADQYFQRAETLPFNFDQTQTSQKYADFAVSVARSAQPAQQAEVSKIIGESIAALNNALVAEPNYPILWQELAEVYLFKNVQNGQLTSVDSEANDAVQRAIDLAPGREEPELLLSQIDAAEGGLDQAEAIIQSLIKEFPTDNQLPAQLGILYNLQGKTDLAVASMQQALSQGYTFSSVDQMQWLMNYYIQQKNYPQALALVRAGG